MKIVSVAALVLAVSAVACASSTEDASGHSKSAITGATLPETPSYPTTPAPKTCSDIAAMPAGGSFTDKNGTTKDFKDVSASLRNVTNPDGSVTHNLDLTFTTTKNACEIAKIGAIASGAFLGLSVGADEELVVGGEYFGSVASGEASCNGTGTSGGSNAKTVSVTITKISATEVSGTFRRENEDAELDEEGTFTAPICDLGATTHIHKHDTLCCE